MTTDSVETEMEAGPKGLFIVRGTVKEVVTTSEPQLFAST